MFEEIEEFNGLTKEDLESRGRLYHRKMRKKHIRRKKRICNSYHIADENNLGVDIPFDWYRVDGKYSKGKIHCGCGVCKFGKKYDLPTLRTERELLKFKYDLRSVNEK